ncbi:hypothetical protein [Asticcacaulis benevestitus]|uniref:Uncharacterized protein n=1 Tax=Asticcacaulis benevestitus DSM 16100 = ATCC BAA-896 TaxID=1121022 RepID=V4P6D8_9CAUL|nr:hypothetical protein [Asticcacaulis benevestitus]ESQ83636.1 hypothetical protein ABENE_20200 [Asticcacaulis benevestitus DSM 16100 = ATCC BAA-896]
MLIKQMGSNGEDLPPLSGIGALDAYIKDKGVDTTDAMIAAIGSLE